MRGDKLRIKDILEAKQPKEFMKLNVKLYKPISEDLSRKDYENMMKHSSYKRNSRGALKQVHYG